MGEAVDMNTNPQQTQPQPQQQQSNPKAKQIQQKDIANKKRLLQQKMQALSRGVTDVDV
jgi:hypothetical protein